jgi:hypothetical protein
MYINEGFLDEMKKEGAAGSSRLMSALKALGFAGAGAAAGAGGAYAVGEKKRKTQLKQLADLFRQANLAENKLLAQRAFAAGKASK